MNLLYQEKKWNFTKSIKGQETLNLWKKFYESTKPMKDYTITNIKIDWFTFTILIDNESNLI